MMPDGITWNIISQKTSKISFTIPSSSKKQPRGLNFCYTKINACLDPDARFFRLPLIRISNVTKNHTWIYMHCIDKIDVGEGEWITYLSHWMFGMNEMESGEQIIITMITMYGEDPVTGNYGVWFVYEEEEEEDTLEYYKSWNHIIGGDLYSFQRTTGEYLLFNQAFTRTDNTAFFNYKGTCQFFLI